MAGLETGRLDRRIAIERAEVVDDGYQNRETNWALIATVWAEYRPGKGSERFAAAAQSAMQPVAFWIRWSRSLCDVSPRDRVRFENRIYAITAVTEIGRREGLELMCVTSDDGSAGA
jgi:SPP1 family predicted phage head-tail adaptor